MESVSWFQILFIYLFKFYIKINSSSSRGSSYTNIMELPDSFLPSIHPNYPLLLVGLLEGIQCRSKSLQLGSKLVCPCVEIHERMLLMSSSLLFSSAQHVLFVLLGWFEMGGKRQYRYCFIECCFHDLFKRACSILVKIPT